MSRSARTVVFLIGAAGTGILLVLAFLRMPRFDHPVRLGDRCGHVVAAG
jgi:hypothetical protein